VRLPSGELDLVAREGHCLVLIEVRLRRGGGSGDALATITPAKRRRLRLLAAEYCATLAERPAELRIDAVGVGLERNGRLREVTLVRNAIEDE